MIRTLSRQTVKERWMSGSGMLSRVAIPASSGDASCTHSHTHTLSHTHTHTLAHSRTHTLSHPHTNTLTHAVSRSPPPAATRPVQQKSIPAQIRQLILYMSNKKGQVDGFVRASTFAKQLYKHFLRELWGGYPSLGRTRSKKASIGK